jgi:hypothetical protein
MMIHMDVPRIIIGIIHLKTTMGITDRGTEMKRTTARREVKNMKRVSRRRARVARIAVAPKIKRKVRSLGIYVPIKIAKARLSARMKKMAWDGW